VLVGASHRFGPTTNDQQPTIFNVAGIQEYGYIALMKATLDIPDVLYRQVKAKSAMEGLPIRLVAIELFSSWVNATAVTTSHQAIETANKSVSLPPWFGIAKPYALKVKQHDMEAVRSSIAQPRDPT